MGLGPKYVNRVNSFLLESDEKRQTKKTKKNGSVKLFKFERKQSFLHVEGLARFTDMKTKNCIPTALPKQIPEFLGAMELITRNSTQCSKTNLSVTQLDQ